MMTMGCVDRLSSGEELLGLLDSFQLRVLAIMTFQVQKAEDMDNVEGLAELGAWHAGICGGGFCRV